MELEHHQPSSLPEGIKARIKNIVLNALDALRITFGASHSELIISHDGDIKVIEVGARMGGDFNGTHLVQLSIGNDFLKGVIEVAFEAFQEPQFFDQSFSGVFFFPERQKN